MTSDNNPEDREPGGSAGQDDAATPKRPQQPYAKIVDQLDETELAQSGTIKLLVSKIKTLEFEKSELSSYFDRYHERNTKVEVLTEQLRRQTLVDALETVLFSIGFLLIGASISMFTEDMYKYALVALVVGGIAAISGAALKVKK